MKKSSTRPDATDEDVRGSVVTGPVSPVGYYLLLNMVTLGLRKGQWGWTIHEKWYTNCHAHSE